ncbi:hypothetical protein RDI58_022519 [Solanum bulbocastanum]|uniref:Uncharacterized protein n=1 Tax=Solanum bulbocastanum TaxID=147425 RepID=A0AAN8T275_SOLBU
MKISTFLKDIGMTMQMYTIQPVLIERIMKQQVEEDLDFAAVSEIGDHDWDTIFPPNSTWQIEQVNTINAEDAEEPDELAEQTEIKDISKVEVVVVMYEITIKRGPQNTKYVIL